MMIKRAIAGTILAAMVAMLLPASPVLADGRASTRNILLGLGAAAAGTYLIIQHNRQVHAKYAADARRQAQLQSQNHDAWAAYNSEKNAYGNAAAEVLDLQKEVAYQHNIVLLQRRELAMVGQPDATVAYEPSNARSTTAKRTGKPAANTALSMVSYGWGSI